MIVYVYKNFSKVMKMAAQQGFSEKLPGVLQRVVNCIIFEIM